MDLNALQSMQNCQQPKRKELILEARHSKCIEASNQIRSKLSPRLFMPRAPLYRHPTKTQHCPKELKPTFFKSQNFKNFNHTNTDFAKETKSLKKCQTQNAQSFVKRLRGKYTKKSKNSKVMENVKENGCKWPSNPQQKRTKAAKSDKNNSKRIKKATKIQNDKKTNEAAKGKCCNLKISANGNSTDNVKYLTDGELVFIADDLYFNSINSTYKAEKFQDFQMNVNDYNGTVTATTNCCLESLNKANSNSGDFVARSSGNSKQPFVHNSKGTTSDKLSKSQNLETEVCNKSKQTLHCPKECCTLESTSKNSSNKRVSKKNVTEKSRNMCSLESIRVLKINVAEKSPNLSVQNALQCCSENVYISRDLLTKINENFQQNPSQFPDLQTNNISANLKPTELNSRQTTCEKIRNYLNLQKMSNESSQTSTKHNSTKSNEEIIRDSPTFQYLYNNQQQPIPNCKEPKEKTTRISNNVPPNDKETLKPPAKQTPLESATIPNSTYLTQADFENPLLYLPIDSYLNRATTAVADFQNTVKSSMSQIYESSPIDKAIHEDLISLDNCVESFSKYLLQSYNDMELMDSKTNNCVAYLNSQNMKNMRIQNQQLRSQPNSTLNKSTDSKETQETVTISIEADILPTKTITFKMSDIIQPKINSSDYNQCSWDNISKEKITNNSINLKRKNTDVDLISNTKISNIEQLNQIKSVQNPSLLNKETTENINSKSSNQEPHTSCVYKENPVNLLQHFVEDAIPKNKPVNPFDIPGKGISMETKCSSEECLITVTNCKKNSSTQVFADPENQMHYRPNQYGTKESPKIVKTCSDNPILSISNTPTHKSNINSSIELNTHNLNTTASNICSQSQVVDNNSSSFTTNPNNLIYTHDQNNYTSFLAPNPLHLNRVSNFPNSITSQAAILNPDLLTNSYNYSHNIPPELPPIHRPYLYPSNPYPNREHQVPNESQILATNQNHSNLIYTPPNIISHNPRQALYPRDLHSEYPQSFLSIPYLQSPYSYYHSTNLMPYPTQYFDNPSKFAATNFLPPSGFEMTHHSMFNTNSEFQIPNG